MKNNKLRSKRLQQYKRNKRIPRYDLANKPVASGYQMGDYFNPGISSVTPGESIDPETQTIKQNILIDLFQHMLNKKKLLVFLVQQIKKQKT